MLLVTTMNDDFMFLVLDWFIRCFSHANCVDIYKYQHCLVMPESFLTVYEYQDLWFRI